MKERDDYQPLPVIYRVFHFAFDESVKAFQWREVANYPEKDSAEILRDRIRNEINARIDSDEGSEKEVVFLSSEPDISKGQVAHSLYVAMPDTFLSFFKWKLQARITRLRWVFERRMRAVPIDDRNLDPVFDFALSNLDERFSERYEAMATALYQRGTLTVEYEETIHKWTLHKPLLPHRNLELSSKMREKDKAQFMESSWGKLSNDRNYVIRSIVTDLMARELSETFIRWS